MAVNGDIWHRTNVDSDSFAYRRLCETATAASQVITELCEALTRLSVCQASGEEIREAAAKIAEEIGSGRTRDDGTAHVATLAADIACGIRLMPLPLSSGSNKSEPTERARIVKWLRERGKEKPYQMQSFNGVADCIEAGEYLKERADVKAD